MSKNKNNKAPSLEQLQAYYEDLRNLLRKNPVLAAEVAKKAIVKNVPIATSYGEVTGAAKAQGLNILQRHLLALTTRPSVWGRSNAFFVPRGSTGFIISPKRMAEDVLQHELGHAEDYARLGGLAGWNKAYAPSFRERIHMSPKEIYVRSVLLPEARAWHYAGKPVKKILNSKDPNKLRDAAYGTYEHGLHYYPDKVKFLVKNLIKNSSEKLVGGKGDHQPDSKYSKKELAKGVVHETEHTDDKSVAKEIAKDHLEEKSDYYDELGKAKLGSFKSLIELLS